MLDRNLPVPLYYQLAEQLKEQIQIGELCSGDQLPSERELSEQFGISRMTVRQAISYLTEQGLLEPRIGVGTFVAAPKFEPDVLHLLGFTEEMMQRGHEDTISRVLETSLCEPAKSISSRLQLANEDKTVKIVRLRYYGGVPLLLETIYIPVKFCPGLENHQLEATSLYAVLEKQYGLQIHYADQTLEATVANAYESQLVGVEPGTAMILLEGVTHLASGLPVEYFKAVYRGDRFKFRLESRREFTKKGTSSPQIEMVLD